MTGYTLANHFRQLRKSFPFSSLEADLYYELVGVGNDLGFPKHFQYSNLLLCATLGISEKSLIAARNRLKQAGLLDFVSGHKRSPTTYQLIAPGEKGLLKVSKSDSVSDSTNGSKSDSVSDSPYVVLKERESKSKPKESTTPFGRGEAQDGPEAELVVEVEAQPAAEELAPEAAQPAPAPKKKVAAKKKPPERATRPSQPEIPFLESELASYEAFEAAFADTDYALANLRYYHEKVKNWRDKKTGEPPLRRDWKATAAQFFLNDVRDNCLKLAPTAQYAASHSQPVASGAGPTGYRSARHDR